MAVGSLYALISSDNTGIVHICVFHVARNRLSDEPALNRFLVRKKNK